METHALETGRTFTSNGARQDTVETEPLSKRWLDLDWREVLPWHIHGLTVDYASIDEASGFIQTHYPEIFGLHPGDQRFLPDPQTASKARFYREVDVFMFRDADHIVGLLLAHPSDWTSYYMRSLALLPEYRGRGFIPAFTDRFCHTLRRAGVQRIDGDVTPVNVANILAQTRLGYIATGTFNTDRWGSMVRVTKYLDETADQVFRSQYCAGTWPRCRHGSPRGAEGSSS